MTIAAPLFVLSVSFIYHPEIVSTALGMQPLITAAVILLGAFTIICGLNYPFALRRRYRLPLRFGLFWLGAFVMVYPDRLIQLVRVGVFALVFVVEKCAAEDRVTAVSSEAGQ